MSTWADSLTSRERQIIARKLHNACQRFRNAPATPGNRRGYDPMTGRMARVAASGEMADLHRDLAGGDVRQ